MTRVLFFPMPSFWYLGLAWALLLSLPAGYLARKKNRSLAGWVALCAGTGLFLGVLGVAWIVVLSTREKVSMRMKYLGMKIEEQISGVLNLPSPVGDNLEKRILMVLAYNPQGLRIGALAQGIGQNWRQIDDVVQSLVAETKIRKEEDRYFFNLD